MKRLTDERIAALAPDEMTVEAAYPDVQVSWDDARHYTRGWNACRAAMLNRALTVTELAKIISAAGKDPSEITDAVWAAGYRKPERAEEDAVALTINIFTDLRYTKIPEDAWPTTYDEILRCELNEIINEELWRDIPPDTIASILIKAGYSLESTND
ncbi:TPA: hypothetical protein ACJG4C_003886 [Salmonella enterica subsp. diarizonae serovar 61:r:z53]